MRTTRLFASIIIGGALLFSAGTARPEERASQTQVPVAETPPQLEEILNRHLAQARVYATNLMTGTNTPTGGSLELVEKGNVLNLPLPPLPVGRHRLWVPMKLVPFGDGRVRDLAVTVKVEDRARTLVMGDFSSKEEFRNFFVDFTTRKDWKGALAIAWEVGRFSKEDRDKSFVKHAPKTDGPAAAALLTEGTKEETDGINLEEEEEEGAKKTDKTLSLKDAASIEVRLEVLPPVVETNVVAATSFRADLLPYKPGDKTFPLCLEGKTGAEIVVSPELRSSVESTTSGSPDVLEKELEFITGARFHVGTQGFGQATIEIGQTAAAQRDGLPKVVEALGRDGFCIRITPEKLFICGGTPSGTAFGVYFFLNDILHTRKYHPYELFHVAPYMPNASLPTGELSMKPDFRLRAFSTGGFYREDCPRSDVWWQPYNGLQYHTDTCPQPYLFHHGMCAIFQTYNQALTQGKLQQKTQEFLKKASTGGEGLGLEGEGDTDRTEKGTDGFEEALNRDAEAKKGPKKKTPEELLYEMFAHCLPKDLPPETREESLRKLLALKAGWQPCYSHPETERICTEVALQTFRDDPELASFSVGMNDSGGFCFCEACRKLLEGEYLVTQDSYKYWNQGSIYYHMMNQVAENVEKESPGMMVGGLCYHYTTSPPRQYKLRDNIFLLRNFYLANTRPDWVEKSLAPWEGKIAHLGIYEYAYPTTIPRFNLHSLQPVLQQRARKDGNFFYAEVYPDWQIEGPKYWLMTQLLWNNQADMKQLMAEYCRDLFGAASETMLEYWDLCARIVPESQERGRSVSPYENPLGLGVVIYPYLDRMKALLAKAESQAQTRAVKERLRHFREPVEADMDLLARIGEAYLGGVAAQPSPDAVIDQAVATVVKLISFEKEVGKITHRCGLANPDMPRAGNAAGIGATITSRLAVLFAQRLRGEGEKDWRALSREAEQATQAAEKRFANDPEKQALGWLKERVDQVFKSTMNAVPRVGKPIVADGVAEDAFLNQALKLRFLRQVAPPSGGKETPKPVETDWTEVYVGYDDAALYFTVRSAESDPTVFEGHSQDGNYNMFTGDAVTFILAPLSGAEIALRITIDVRGKVYAWVPPAQLAQAYDAQQKVWTVEMALPWDYVYFTEQKMKPGAFELLRANFLRHYKVPDSQLFRGHGPATPAASWFAPAANDPAGRSPDQAGLLVLE
jgi:hypothetical protein